MLSLNSIPTKLFSILAPNVYFNMTSLPINPYHFCFSIQSDFLFDESCPELPTLYFVSYFVALQTLQHVIFLFSNNCFSFLFDSSDVQFSRQFFRSVFSKFPNRFSNVVMSCLFCTLTLPKVKHLLLFFLIKLLVILTRRNFSAFEIFVSFPSSPYVYNVRKEI